MEFGCRECNRSFNELRLWDRLKNENYQWICTSCNVPLIRDPKERYMHFGCRKCNHSFEELAAWEWLKFCGDYWKCLSCGGDITKDFKTVMEDSMAFAKTLWQVDPLI